MGLGDDSDGGGGRRCGGIPPVLIDPVPEVSRVDLEAAMQTDKRRSRRFSSGLTGRRYQRECTLARK